MGRFEGGGVISELEEMGASKIIYACICVWINLSKREGVQHRDGGGRAREKKNRFSFAFCCGSLWLVAPLDGGWEKIAELIFFGCRRVG